ncbi:hypothetical protein [Microbacterium sp. 18062]|uniref:hypothetical protein n=1 Tax=Microbacterium sp. 18062 TaxID=2681410 RepID=UPI00135B6309|nr:hypothetical protein [Microbacterium sp. 18062]
MSERKRNPNWWLGLIVGVFALAVVGLMWEEWIPAAILAVGIGVVAAVIFPRRTS